MESTYKPDVMLYHANCADGFGAAWAVWMKWGDAVDYRPASYGQEPPTDLVGKHVLIGDFSYKQDAIDKLSSEVASLVILDHHQTAESELQRWRAFVDKNNSPLTIPALEAAWQNERINKTVASFDMKRSGARMVWDFCFPGEDCPMIIKLIEDRDLWRFNFEATKPFGLWLRSEPFDFERWEMISQELEDGEDGPRLLTEARAMQRFFEQKVGEIAGMARMSNVGGHAVPVCNCPPMFASEVGHKLLDDFPDAPFAACYSDQGEARGWSLRSRDERQDVSEIARKFGGGGHRNAAGFGSPLV